MIRLSLDLDASSLHRGSGRLVVNFRTLPSGACTSERGWLVTTSAAEILGAARVPFALVRSVCLALLSVSFPCVSLVKRE